MFRGYRPDSFFNKFLERKTFMLSFLAASLFEAPFEALAQKRERTLFEGKLANAPGQSLTAEVVDFPPGFKSDVHHHAGSVFACLLTGRIRSQNSATGPARIYEAGQSFFEPLGGDHLVTENPSSTEYASLLAIHVAAEGAVLTKPGKRGSS